MYRNIIDINKYWRKRRNTLLIFTGLLIIFIPLKNQSIAHSYNKYSSANLNCDKKPICLKDNQINFPASYQKKASEKIQEAERDLMQTSKLFSIPYNPKIGIAYLHQGRNNWTVKLVYGGIVLKIPDQTIYSTQEIYQLKKVFENTDQVTFNGKSYPTTRSVKQIGPILHE